MFGGIVLLFGVISCFTMPDSPFDSHQTHSVFDEPTDSTPLIVQDAADYDNLGEMAPGERQRRELRDMSASNIVLIFVLNFYKLCFILFAKLNNWDRRFFGCWRCFRLLLCWWQTCLLVALPRLSYRKQTLLKQEWIITSVNWTCLWYCIEWIGMIMNETN